MNKLETATFAAGCFWGIENLFMKLKGVTETKVDYIGGKISNPTYEEVCSRDTEHAEAIQIQYDPEIISYEDLLEIFWENHNPTTPNQQGPDYGNQYRSAIFYHNDQQKLLAEKSKQDLIKLKRWKNDIVTNISYTKEFFPAEDYHQKYYLKNGLGACSIN